MTIIKALLFAPILIYRGLSSSPAYLAFLHFGGPAFVILTGRFMIDVLPTMFLLGSVLLSYVLLATGFIRFWWRGYKEHGSDAFMKKGE